MTEICTVQYIDHVGVAVGDIQGALEFFYNTFGIEPAEIQDLPDQRVKAALLTLGQTRLELLQPLDIDSPVGRFLDRRGEGLHHLAFNVADISLTLSSLEAGGLQLVDKVPKEGLSGLIGFVHPRSVYGILTELVQTQ